MEDKLAWGCVVAFAVFGVLWFIFLAIIDAYRI